jgi:two-component system sensor kinase FixL
MMDRGVVVPTAAPAGYDGQDLSPCTYAPRDLIAEAASEPRHVHRATLAFIVSRGAKPDRIIMGDAAMTSPTGRPENALSGDPARLFNRRYMLAVAVVVLLLLLNQVLVQPPLLQLAIDAPVINVAGRQRMLSQQLAKFALSADRSTDELDRRRQLARLEDVLRQWSTAHDGLRHAQAATSGSGQNSGAVVAAFEEIQPFFTRIRHATLATIKAYSPTGQGAREGREALTTMLENEGEFLSRMDRIVSLYEAETRARVSRLLWTGWAVSGLIVVALIVLGRVVLRPAAQLIQRQIFDLRRAQDTLEDRVRERTHALEKSNELLAHEVQERSLAEARHRSLLETFSHVSRTNTLGEMASGLGHELNQPLGAIANYAEGCLVELESPAPALVEVRVVLEKILATTFRAGQVLRRIRRFVTRHGLEIEEFEPNRIVEETADLVADEVRRHGFLLQTDLAPDLPRLSGDSVQIQQVLINLVRNAIEATTISKPVDHSVLMRTRRSDDETVEFSVTDHGEGIEADRIDRVFDAYFSTRADGMGMGLAISRTIIEAHHGRLTVESVPGVETTFRFTLPVVGAEDDAGPNSLHRG